jgi:nucleotide-binding universal stress UspA family protein
MPETSPPSPAIVVGIDGSRSAVEAALWAIDEAVDRDLPLRLLYVIEPSRSCGADSQSMARDFVTAEAAVRYASMAVESAERPVKLELEIVHGRCVDALVAASRSAAMICLGALGADGAGGERVGSTPPALVARARCPVAIVRRPPSRRREKGWVTAVVDHSAAAPPILAQAVREARLRSAPLRVLTGRVADTLTGADTLLENARLAEAELEDALTYWRVRYPEVDIQAVTVSGSPLDYLARQADSVEMIVLGHRPSDELSELVLHPELTGVPSLLLVCAR